MSAYTKRLNEEFEHELHLRLVEERQLFEGDLAGWTARQRGIEAALEGESWFKHSWKVVFRTVPVRLLKLLQDFQLKLVWTDTMKKSRKRVSI